MEEIPRRDHGHMRDPGWGPVSAVLSDAGAGGARGPGNQGKDEKSEPWGLSNRYG